MDNLVLTRLVSDWSRELPGAILEEFRQESDDRFRLVFASSGEILMLVASLRPEQPWIGRPVLRWRGPRWSPGPIAVAIAKRLVGARVLFVSKRPSDRSLRVDFGEGRGLAFELTPHAANVVLLGDGGTVEAAARQSKRAAERLAPGAVWQEPAPPAGRLDPFAATSDEIDRHLATEPARLAGVASSIVDRLRAEASQRGLTTGQAVRQRLDEILRGATEVVIEGPGDPHEAIPSGTFAEPAYRIVPWRTRDSFQQPTAAATAGLFYEGIEHVARIRGRLAALGSIVRSELRRAAEAKLRVEAEIPGYDDAARLQRMGEVLLAGLSVARRSGETVWVPDPYGGPGDEIAIPAPAGVPLPQVADDLFRRSRRARRGRETATARARFLEERASGLSAILARGGTAPTEAEVASLESAMESAGLPIGIKRATRAGRAAERLAPPRLAGVRTLKSADGWTILIGRTGKDNDRLTFKVAAPEDVWLHAADVGGAHVVIRNPDRAATIPESTLREAAAAAAWFSDGRAATLVDVHWARRKHVRRARGGPPGRVTLKRFETIRVKAAPPEDRARRDEDGAFPPKHAPKSG